MRRGVNVYAWQSIDAGEEITIDYRLNAFGSERWPCKCGTKVCTGWVENSFFALSEQTQAAYVPYAPRFILAEYRRRLGRVGNEDI